MPSRCEQIMLHLTGTTNGAGILGAVAGVGGRVWRDRAEVFTQPELPALLVLEGNENATPGFTSCRTRWLKVIEIRVMVTGGPVGQLADPIRVSLHKILTADLTLGGLSTAVKALSADWIPDKGNNEPGELVLRYQIDYVTRENDLTI